MNASKISAITTLLLSFFILSGFVPVKYSGGSGDPNNPYQIGSAADLLELAAETNDYNKCFILTADINLGSLDPCTTAIIAPDTTNPDTVFNGTAFTGVFDGNGHTISNLTIDTLGAENSYLGLFGKIGTGSQIKNLGIENFNITGGDGSCSLGGLAGDSDGNISNCYSTGDVNGGKSSFYLGGLAGVTGGGTISDCYSAGTVTGGNNSTHLGGLVGWNSGTISNCFSTDAVAGGNGSWNLGGLAGWNELSTISNCFATGTVAGGTVSYYLGGLVGENHNTISKCYSTGAVTGTAYLGGLTGHSDGTISNCYSTASVTGQSGSEYIGGLEGVNAGDTNNCYSTGVVTGSIDVGGLVGFNNDTITACFWDTTTSGQATSAGGTGKTTSEMKTESTFTNAGWNFVNIWRIREGVSYPKLNMSSYSGGSGTTGDPYQIATVADLLAMAANTYDYDAYFILTADINLASSGTFTTAVIAPDTNNSNYTFDEIAFTGIFDGNNHTISNLIVDTNGAENDFLGLFGEIGSGGQVKNLDLKNVRITGGDNSCDLGGLAGQNYYGTISDCNSAGTISGGSPSWLVGGLTGRNTGTISNCSSSGAVSGENNSWGLGGLAGYNYYGTISNCHSSGTVSGGDGSSEIGGLVGATDNGNISNSYSTCAVSGEDESESLGGLVGDDHSGNISNCWSSGTIASGNASQSLGGLTGFNYDADISNCYSAGNINGGSGSVALGGLSGRNFGGGGAISDCFATGNVNSDANSQKLGGLAGFNDCSYIYSSYSTGNVTSGGSDSCDIGGLVGDNGSGIGTIENCYSTGNANGGGGTSRNIGGLVGNNNGSIGDCYSTGTASGGATNVHQLVGYHSAGGGGPDIINGCYFLGKTIADNNIGQPLTDKQMKQQKSFTGWDFGGIWWINEKVSYPKLFWQLNVTNCTVTAGSKPNTDKISILGTMNASADDINDANVIEITIDSADMVNPCIQTFPIDEKSFKKGIYNYARTENASSTFFKFDTKTRKFSFMAKNVDLSGLNCPAIMKIDIGDYNGIVLLDEKIVNGPTKPIPIQLMTGVRNVLRVDKCTVKQSKKLHSDQLSVSGAFTVEDPNVSMADRVGDDLVITLGSQTFTIPKVNLKPGKDKFTCSNVKIKGGTATATFNFKLCSFTLTIKNADIPTGLGDVDFGVAFADFDETAQVTLP
ncbi:MAG: GLUG motif-containing protein [Sedimentisphaerales bacterium]